MLQTKQKAFETHMAGKISKVQEDTVHAGAVCKPDRKGDFLARENAYIVQMLLLDGFYHRDQKLPDFPDAFLLTVQNLVATVLNGKFFASNLSI